jgi:hypothetical protein
MPSLRTTQTSHSRILGGGTMFYLSGSMEYMFWSGSYNSRYGLAMAQHNNSISPLHPDWTTPPPLTWLHHYFFVLFQGVCGWCRGMGWVHELPHSAGVHTGRTPDCMNLVPVLLTWHSTLYNRHPLHTIATYTEC